VARRQTGVIQTRQLEQCGIGEEAIRHLLAKHVLHRHLYGVYAFEPKLSQEGRLQAAVLACPEGAAAAFAAAAWLWRLRASFPVRIEVVLPRRTGSPGPKGVILRHSVTLTEADFTLVRGIRTTSLERTIRDSARTLGPPALRRYLQQAERQGFDIRALDRPRIPARLRAALDLYIRGSGWTANELEARFYELCAAVGLPMPRRQGELDSMFVDFVWDEVSLIVETDGRDTHDGWVAATEDRARDRHLVIAGYAVLRFTWADVRWRPDMVKADLLAAYYRVRT
jgi:hypothetical protein